MLILKKLLKEISESIISGDFKEIADRIAKKLGIATDEIGLITLAGLKQLDKAISI